MHAATEALSTEMSKIGEAMNKAGAAPENGTTAEPQNPEVQDAETMEGGEKKE